MAFTAVTVNFAFVNPDGSLPSGWLSFAPVVEMSNGTTVVAAEPVRVQLVAGAGSVVLYATDDAGTTPVGNVYRVTKAISGEATPAPQFFALPRAVTPVDLSALVPLLAAPQMFTYALAADLATANTAIAANAAAIATKAALLGVATTRTTAGALVANKHNPVDATSGPLTMTLPTGQAQGSIIIAEKFDSTANAVTVSGNIRGVPASTDVLVMQHQTTMFEADAAGSWWPVASHKALATLDGRYAAVSDLATANTAIAANTAAIATKAAPGGPSQVKRRASGNIVVTQQTTWSDLDRSLDLVVNAQVGDLVEVGMAGLTKNEAQYLWIDCVSVVNDAPVNAWSENGPEVTGHQGNGGWQGQASAYLSLSGTQVRVLTANDISSGRLTVRFRAYNSAAAGKTIYASAGNPLMVWAVNHGPGLPVVPPPVPFGGTEAFLDQQFVASTTGVTLGVNVPTKYVSNPLVPVNADAWDQIKSYTSLVYQSGVYYLFYYAAAVLGGTPYTCYATSSDGLAFTKPNIGRITYGGNTNNNIIYQATFTSAQFDAVSNLWVITHEGNPGGTIAILTSSTPSGPYTQVQSITPSPYGEGKCLVHRTDGRWIVYFTHGHSTNHRSITAYISDTTSLAGTWTQYGEVIAATDANHQIYAFGVVLNSGLYYGFAMAYSDAGIGTSHIDLYVSRDGLFWTFLKANWLPLGAGGTFEADELVNGNTLAEVSTSWHYYYLGEKGGERVTTDNAIARATIGKGRIGQVSGAGSIRTTTLTVTGGQVLTVNANGTGGGITVAVLDASGTVLTGFNDSDFTPLTTDNYAHAPLWGANPMPTGRTLQLRFTIAGTSVLYGYTIT